MTQLPRNTRRGICGVCGADFQYRPDAAGKHCSRRCATLVPLSEETKERRAASMRRVWGQPGYRDRLSVSASVSKRAKLASDPAMRARYVQAARDSYAAGIGLGSPEADRNKRIAAKWILKRCWEELLAATGYAETYRIVQARYRAELPFDPTGNDADYTEYLAQLGRVVNKDPALRAIIDPFMSAAIPRWSAAWQALKAGRPA